MPSSSTNPPLDLQDPQALADWLMQVLIVKIPCVSIKARYTQYLQLLIEADGLLEIQSTVEILTPLLNQLRLQSQLPKQFSQVDLYVCQRGEVIPDWYSKVDLTQVFDPSPELTPDLALTHEVELMPISATISAADQTSSHRPPSRIEAARAGDLEALHYIFNYLLRGDRIQATLHLNRKAGYLQIILIGLEVPDETRMVNFLGKTIGRLELRFLQKLRISGQKQGSFFPAWSYEFDLSTNPTFWHSVGHMTTRVTQISTQMGQSMADTASAATTALINAGSQAIVQTTTQVGQVMSAAAVQATAGMGPALAPITDNPHIKTLTKCLKVDWLSTVIEQVNTQTVTTYAQNLKLQYSDETAKQIARRIIVHKVLLAAGTGVLTSVMPDPAATLLAVDLVANLALQVEMIYQIAAAYNLDLSDPARQGEVLTIFGFALGGNEAVKLGASYATKAGFDFLRSAPAVGSVIAVSTNVALLYALGYAACRYYEAKVDLAKVDPLTSPATIAIARAAGENYLPVAIHQELVMDQMLSHVILAGYPEKTWPEVVSEIQSANLSPASIEVLNAQLSHPPNLQDLLDQVNADFAIPLLARCLKLADTYTALHPDQNAAQFTIIQTIQAKFNIDKDKVVSWN